MHRTTHHSPRQASCCGQSLSGVQQPAHPAPAHLCDCEEQVPDSLRCLAAGVIPAQLSALPLYHLAGGGSCSAERSHRGQGRLAVGVRLSFAFKRERYQLTPEPGLVSCPTCSRSSWSSFPQLTQLPIRVHVCWSAAPTAKGPLVASTPASASTMQQLQLHPQPQQGPNAAPLARMLTRCHSGCSRSIALSSSGPRYRSITRRISASCACCAFSRSSCATRSRTSDAGEAAAPKR